MPSLLVYIEPVCLAKSLETNAEANFEIISTPQHVEWRYGILSGLVELSYLFLKDLFQCCCVFFSMKGCLKTKTRKKGNRNAK